MGFVEFAGISKPVVELDKVKHAFTLIQENDPWCHFTTDVSQQRGMCLMFIADYRMYRRRERRTITQGRWEKWVPIPCLQEAVPLLADKSFSTHKGLTREEQSIILGVCSDMAGVPTIRIRSRIAQLVAYRTAAPWERIQEHMFVFGFRGEEWF